MKFIKNGQPGQKKKINFVVNILKIKKCKSQKKAKK